MLHGVFCILSVDTYARASTEMLHHCNFVNDLQYLSKKSLPKFVLSNRKCNVFLMTDCLQNLERSNKRKLSFTHLFIGPVQRIPRYELLLKVSRHLLQLVNYVFLVLYPMICSGKSKHQSKLELIKNINVPHSQSARCTLWILKALSFAVWFAICLNLF